MTALADSEPRAKPTPVRRTSGLLDPSLFATGRGSLKFADLIGFAASAILAHRIRSALTALGVVIGVAAVVLMTSIGTGAQQAVTKAISGLGSNLIIVQPGGGRAVGGF